MYNNKKNRFVPSDSSFNVKDLYIDGSKVALDDWKQTFLIDEKPISIPGSNSFVMLPSEIGLPSPSYFISYPYTGESLFEEYQSSYYLATGWSVALGKPGLNPAHLDSMGNLIIAPLSGRLYARPLDSNIKTTITYFSIDSGDYFNFGQIPETTISGNQIIGWDLFYSLSGAEDLSVTLHGRYSDIYQENISNGVIMTSGDAAVSFFLEYGALTGDGVLEYYIANEFIATRWGIYAGSPGTSTLSLNPFATQYPLSGRFYFRDPKDNIKTTIAHFNLTTGSIANWQTIQPDFYIPFRKIIGVDIYYGLNDLKNVHIILGGQGIASANYFQNIVTKQIFDIFSGSINEKVDDALDQIGSSVAGVSSLNASYGALKISGISGIEVSSEGYPSEVITVKYSSGNFNNVDLVPQGADFPYKEGRIFYSSDTKTLNAFLDAPDVTLNIGQEEYIRGVNKTSNTILNGTPVYISGAQGQRPQVWPALASNKYHIEHLVGLATHDILNNEEGFITTRGIVNGVDTASFNPGDVLFLGATGNIANTLPSSLNSSYIKLGYTLTSQNNGKILVDIDTHNEDGNVTIKDVNTNPYYFIKSDIGKMITFSGAGSAYTGYLNSTGGFNVGDYISIMNIGTGTLRITGEPGIVIGSRDNARSLTTRYSVMEAIYRSQDFWLLYGDLE